MSKFKNFLIARYAPTELIGGEFVDPSWPRAEVVSISSYWSGETAPTGRHAKVRALWSDDALYLRFDLRQVEALVVSAQPVLEAKTIGLWDRDVCEAFIAPDPDQPQRYFEFEAAPTGEWLDLAIEQTADGRLTDWEYRSGMSVTSTTEPGQVVITMQIPWSAFGRRPEAGEQWRANFFRCVGAGETRGYLAWQPTLTEKPNFHVPERFGVLVFEK